MCGEAMKLLPERETSGKRWRESTKRVGVYSLLVAEASLHIIMSNVTEVDEVRLYISKKYNLILTF